MILAVGALWLSTGSLTKNDRALEAAPAVQSASVTEVPGAAEATPLQEEEAAAQEEEHAEEGPGDLAATFFLILVAILVFAKVFGELAERIGQPAVLGELIAGVVLGGSVLAILPSGGEIGEVIHLLSEVGVAILLFEIGLETDLKEMFRVGPAAASVAGVGVALPFLLGFVYWWWADPSIGAVAAGADVWTVAIFVGATLTATSVGITARVLTDLKLMHRAESKIIIGAAVIDDVLGLVILAIVSGLAAGAGFSLLGMTQIFAMAVGFLVFAVIIGNWVAPKLFGVIDRMSVRGVLLVSAFCFALFVAALAHKADSAMIIGAFAAGIVLSSTNQFDLIVERIEPVADIFTPIFFVFVGSQVDVNLFLPWSESFNANVIVVGVILIGIAIVGKVLSGFAAGWGKNRINQLAIGVGMVPRGEVGLIFAQIGLTTGILTQETFSAILIMVMVTTFIAPPVLKLVFRPDPDDFPTSEGTAEVSAGH